MRRDLAIVAPELAQSLRAVYRVSRAAVTGPQRAAATRAADRLTLLAVRAGWTQAEIADAIHAHPSSVSARINRQNTREPTPPPLTGLHPPTAAPLTEAAVGAARRRRLIGPAEVARLVGCQPASVTAWAAARDLRCEWTPGHAKRLYDRHEVLLAADRHPLQRHPHWERLNNIAVPPQNRPAHGGATERALPPAR